jgi:hypothetical protein
MKLLCITAAAMSALIVGVSATRADDNLQTLEGFRMTAPIDWPTIPQTGPKADAVRQILQDKIKLPPGFHIELYALVPDARHMAVGPQGVVTFVGTRKNKIWAVTDRSRAGGEGGGIQGGGIEVKEFAPTLAKRLPNGPCFSKDGFLYVVEQNRVLQYPAAEFFYEGQDVAVSRRRSGGAAHSEGGGEFQPHRARMPRRA